jgi:Na+-translocating ferredoxin:NAD+ oxidoreductase RnfE subunit
MTKRFPTQTKLKVVIESVNNLVLLINALLDVVDQFDNLKNYEVYVDWKIFIPYWVVNCIVFRKHSIMHIPRLINILHFVTSDLDCVYITLL